ncbi:hypothetical protein GCM10009754_77590 [Amycolatopsis minnesotensis]|uniref:DUF3039 domain-containing protein n=1 Tax=Amycolatopsis minnesotensis TaxID=337894 RepID=A0ABP5DXF2_9PSEU
MSSFASAAILACCHMDTERDSAQEGGDHELATGHGRKRRGPRWHWPGRGRRVTAPSEPDGPLRPIVGGVRHRVAGDPNPPDGVTIRMLCGFLWKVHRTAKSPHIYDCHACDEEFDETAAK